MTSVFYRVKLLLWDLISNMLHFHNKCLLYFECCTQTRAWMVCCLFVFLTLWIVSCRILAFVYFVVSQLFLLVIDFLSTMYYDCSSDGHVRLFCFLFNHKMTMWQVANKYCNQWKSFTCVDRLWQCLYFVASFTAEHCLWWNSYMVSNMGNLSIKAVF